MTYHQGRLVRILLLAHTPIDQSMRCSMAANVGDCRFDSIERYDFVGILWLLVVVAVNCSNHWPER